MRHLLITIVLLVPSFNPLLAQEPVQPADPMRSALASMRRQGLSATTQIVTGIMARAPKEHFPGTAAWIVQHRAALLTIDPNKPPATWPRLDLDKLVSRNPTFWRMVFENYPGDPMVLTLVAGLQMAAGEAYRASDTLRMAIRSPNRPEVIRRTLRQVQGSIGGLLTLSRGRIRQGIALHDKGDLKGAIKIYKAIIASWPQEGWAHFELGQSVRLLQMKKDPKQALAVNAHHAACRRHNPLMWQAWQGSDRTVINGLMGLKLRLLPAWAKMMQGRDLTNAFSDIAAGAQQAGLHQMAIFSAMLATDHRGKYAEGYHALIAKSLRALAAGKPTEALLEAIVKPGRKLFSPAKHEKPAQPK